MSAGRYFDVIEACYRVDLDDDAWLSGIAAAASQAVGSALGVAALLYDGDHRGIPQRMQFAGGCDAAWAEAFLVQVATGQGHDGAAVDAIERASQYVHSACVNVRRPCSLLRSSRALAPIAHAVGAWGGASDMLLVQGFDPTGAGVWIGAPRRRRAELARSTRDACGRLATHLAVGLRARRTVGARRSLAVADAVSSPDGRLLHAEPDAQEATMREAIRRSVVALERARRHPRKEDAAGGPRGLVEARWSLLDHFDADGRRFVVAVKNQAKLAEDAWESLTGRELQVVAHAALGHHNKQIAYDLGIAHGTVRVLHHRAAKKLGVATRRELIERFREHEVERRSHGDDSSGEA